MPLTPSPSSRSSVAQISWGSDSQVNMLLLCKQTRTQMENLQEYACLPVSHFLSDMLMVSVFLLQTELLPHCSDVPPVARVMQEDGKLLIQAVLEVRNIRIHIYTSQDRKVLASLCCCSWLCYGTSNQGSRKKNAGQSVLEDFNFPGKLEKLHSNIYWD